jgi:hypothetical protein
MDNQNQAKKIINQQILGNQPENPYTDLANGQQPQQQQQPINHQAAFEAQLRQQQQNPQMNAGGGDVVDNTYAFEQNDTYCRTGTIENGFIESDLQIYKAKGTETRFISFSILSMLDEAQIEEVKSRNGLANLTMIMTSEEQFNKFKQFVSSLDWNS